MAFAQPIASRGGAPGTDFGTMTPSRPTPSYSSGSSGGSSGPTIGATNTYTLPSGEVITQVYTGNGMYRNIANPNAGDTAAEKAIIQTAREQIAQQQAQTQPQAVAPLAAKGPAAAPLEKTILSEAQKQEVIKAAQAADYQALLNNLGYTGIYADPYTKLKELGIKPEEYVSKAGASQTVLAKRTIQELEREQTPYARNVLLSNLGDIGFSSLILDTGEKLNIQFAQPKEIGAGGYSSYSLPTLKEPAQATSTPKSLLERYPSMASGEMQSLGPASINEFKSTAASINDFKSYPPPSISEFKSYPSAEYQQAEGLKGVIDYGVKTAPFGTNPLFQSTAGGKILITYETPKNTFENATLEEKTGLTQKPNQTYYFGKGTSPIELGYELGNKIESAGMGIANDLYAIDFFQNPLGKPGGLIVEYGSKTLAGIPSSPYAFKQIALDLTTTAKATQKVYSQNRIEGQAQAQEYYKSQITSPGNILNAAMIGVSLLAPEARAAGPIGKTLAKTGETIVLGVLGASYIQNPRQTTEMIAPFVAEVVIKENPIGIIKTKIGEATYTGIEIKPLKMDIAGVIETGGKYKTNIGSPKFETANIYKFEGSAAETNIADVYTAGESRIQTKAIADYLAKEAMPIELGRLYDTQKAVEYAYNKPSLPFEKGLEIVKESELVKTMPEKAQNNLLTTIKGEVDTIYYGSSRSAMSGALERPFGDIDLYGQNALMLANKITESINLGGGKAKVVESTVNIYAKGQYQKLFDVHDMTTGLESSLNVGSSLENIGFGYPKKAEVQITGEKAGIMAESTGTQAARLGSSISFLRETPEGIILSGSAKNVKRAGDFIAMIEKYGEVYNNPKYAEFGTTFEKYLNPYEKQYLEELKTGKITLEFSNAKSLKSSKNIISSIPITQAKNTDSINITEASTAPSKKISSNISTKPSLSLSPSISTKISASLSPSTSIKPSSSISPSLSTKSSPSLSIKPSPSAQSPSTPTSPSLSPSPRPGPSPSLSTRPSISFKPSLSTRPSISTPRSPELPRPPTSRPPSLFSSNRPSSSSSFSNLLNKRTKPRTGSAGGLYSDLLSIQQSQRKYGRATSPTTSNIVKSSGGVIGLKVKTVEQRQGKAIKQPRGNNLLRLGGVL